MMITLNLEKEFLKDIDSTVKIERYANRTELIREALRDKLVALRQRQIMEAITRIQQSQKGRRITKEEYNRVRNDPHILDSNEDILRRMGFPDVRKK